MKAAALEFAAAHPVVAAVIAGARTADGMRQNAAMMKRPIPSEFWAGLKEGG